MITELLSNHSKFYLIFFLVGVFFRLKKTIWLDLTVLLKIPASVTVYRGVMHTARTTCASAKQILAHNKCCHLDDICFREGFLRSVRQCKPCSGCIIVATWQPAVQTSHQKKKNTNLQQFR